MIKKNRLCSLLLVCALLTVVFAGCSNEQDDWDKTEVPQYTVEREMMIGAWVEPINTLEDYRLAKDMGITHLYLAGDYTGGRHTQEFEQLLELCEQVGLKAIIRAVNDPNFNDARDYSEFPAVTGISYWDEPFDTEFDKVAALADYHMATYGDKLEFVTNLNPNETSDGWHPWSDSKTYSEYVNEY